MATRSGWLIVRGDYSANPENAQYNPTSVPPNFYPSKDATPGNSFGDSFAFTVRLPDGSTQAVTEDRWFQVFRDEVEACNVMVQSRLIEKGLRLVEVQWDVTDTAGYAIRTNPTPPPPFLIRDPGKQKDYGAIVRADVISEVDEATIRSTATVEWVDYSAATGLPGHWARKP